MSHLSEIQLNYFQHLYRAWRWALMLLVHGLLPNVWKDKVSKEMCVEVELDNKTRIYMLDKMYHITERSRETPGVYDRLSDREVQARILLGEKQRALGVDFAPVKKTKKIKANKKKNK